MTSLYPTQLGLVEEPASPAQTFQPREKRRQLNYILPVFNETLAQVLRTDGYKTCAFVNQPALNPVNGFLRGFSECYYPVTSGKIVKYNPVAPELPQTWNSIECALINDRALAGEFDKWLIIQNRKKIFVWLHLLTPHYPYLPEKAFAGTPNISPSQRYDAEIHELDQMIGKITRSIKKNYGLKRSVIVLTADHGEEFQEHGSEEHGHSLYNEVIKVPLIMISEHLKPNTRDSQYVRMIDIMPTILAMVHSQAADSVKMEGKNLLVNDKEHDWGRPVYSEGILYGNSRRSLIFDRYKVILDQTSNTWQLFDLRNDPLEKKNISTDYPDILQMMQVKLTKRHTYLTESYTRLCKKFPQRNSKKAQEMSFRLLESLGYINR